MPSVPRIVIDTNVLITAVLSSEGFGSRLFTMILKRFVVNFTSQEILDEMSFVVRSLEFNGRISTNDFVLFEVYRKNSVLLEDVSPVFVVSDDHDDDKILACARAAKADYVITEDWHLLKIKRWSDIEIMTPEQFLMLVGHK